MVGALIFYIGLLGLAGYFVMTEPTGREVSKPVVTTVIDMPKRVVKPARKVVVQKSLGLPEWFCVPDIKPSPAEKLIIAELKKYRCKWYREIAFTSFPSSKYGHYRYDFMIPSLRLIIEYHGEQWHNSPERQKIDRVKREFCAQHSITVIEYSKKHYYKMGSVIAELMNSYGISMA